MSNKHRTNDGFAMDGKIDRLGMPARCNCMISRRWRFTCVRMRSISRRMKSMSMCKPSTWLIAARNAPKSPDAPKSPLR
jgi:hypothetical protein